MSDRLTRKASRNPLKNSSEPITTAFRGQIYREYFAYQPDTIESQDEFTLDTTRATKRKRTRYDEMESVARKYDDVESPTRRPSGEDSSAPGYTVIRSDSSSSTLAADEEKKHCPQEKPSGDSDQGDMKVADAARQSDSGYEGGEESEADARETSSHTLGRSEGSSRTMGRSEGGDCNGDRGEDEEMEDGESDGEGDLFAQSYREGSRK